jgi:HD-GYP domain-containing protein (c-di-GMP phosphodiesterase class II)
VSEAVRFLHALAQVFSAMSLYTPGHPAATRAAALAWQALEALLVRGADQAFLFLGDAPIHGGRPLHELATWPWSPRLAKVGMQRIEFHDGVTAEGFAELLARIQARLINGDIPPDESIEPLDGIEYGAVVVQEQDEEATVDFAPLSLEGMGEGIVDMTDELDAFRFIRSEAAAGRVARAEADAVVRLLLGCFQHHRLPQALAPSDADAYSGVHAINTACLTIAAGRAAGLERTDLYHLGSAALLHDIGMARLPARFVGLAALTEAERATVESHPALGAELLLTAGGPGAELAAAVAWEHHLRPDGTGYPRRRFRAPVHWASRLISVTSTFVSLRCERPFRPAWAPARVLAFLEEGAGTVYDVEAARSIVALVRG